MTIDEPSIRNASRPVTARIYFTYELYPEADRMSRRYSWLGSPWSDQQEQTRAALIAAARTSPSTATAKPASTGSWRPPGLSRGAIYANFEGKPGLFLAVLDDRLQTQITELEGIGTDLQQLGRWRRKDACRERGLTLALLQLRALVLREEPLRRQLVQRERKLRQAFAGLLTQAAEHLWHHLPTARDRHRNHRPLARRRHHRAAPPRSRPSRPQAVEAVLATLISQLQPPA